jgi:hypothetical protein
VLVWSVAWLVWGHAQPQTSALFAIQRAATLLKSEGVSLVLSLGHAHTSDCHRREFRAKILRVCEQLCFERLEILLRYTDMRCWRCFGPPQKHSQRNKARQCNARRTQQCPELNFPSAIKVRFLFYAQPWRHVEFPTANFLIKHNSRSCKLSSD